MEGEPDDGLCATGTLERCYGPGRETDAPDRIGDDGELHGREVNLANPDYPLSLCDLNWCCLSE
jgi:hypothetical protein